MSTISLFSLFFFFILASVSMAGNGSHVVLAQGNINQILTTQPAAKVKVVKKGRKYEINQTDYFMILKTLPDILNSCQSREKRRVTEELWQMWMRSGICLRVQYDTPQTFFLKIQPELTVDELLIFITPHTLQGKILVLHDKNYLSPFIGCDVTPLMRLSD